MENIKSSSTEKQEIEPNYNNKIDYGEIKASEVNINYTESNSELACYINPNHRNTDFLDGKLIKRNTNQLTEASTIIKQPTFTRLEVANIFERFPQLEYFKNYDKFELKRLAIRKQLVLIVIDTFCSILNISIVTILYFEHFSFVRNSYVIEEGGNQIRWFCLFMSIAVCLLIILRIFQYENLQNIKYLLNLRGEILKKKLLIQTVLAEILIHLIQPYPYLDNHWKIQMIGKNVLFSLSGILFSLSILRFYVGVKVIYYWNFYTNDKSKRLFKFFKNKQTTLFLYKANIKTRGFITLIFILLIFIYLFALIFKVFEDYEPYEDENGFSNIWNCLWYLIITITMIGYGDFRPKSIIGRIIGVFCCMIGIFILSLIVVALLLLATFNSEEEIAYKLIDLEYTQMRKNNYITNYSHTYIQYKMWRFKKAREIKDYFIKRNRYTNHREAFLIKIKAKLEHSSSITKFCQHAKDLWFKDSSNNKYNLALDCIGLSQSMQPLVEATQSSLNHFKNSKKYSFKMFNMARLMTTLGSYFEIQNINQLKGDGIISADNVNSSLKEFHVKFKERKITKFQTKRINITENIADFMQPSDSSSESFYSSYNFND